MIGKDSWRIVEYIIRRYPAVKKEYEEYVFNIITSSSPPAAGINTEDKDYTKPQSVTESKALKMNSAYMHRIKNQIEAVELVYENLHPEERRLMEQRFWVDRSRNIPYTKIRGVNYSERQMKRIIKKIIIQVGKYIGEIK